jgi:hypothetical protein
MQFLYLHIYTQNINTGPLPLTSCLVLKSPVIARVDVCECSSREAKFKQAFAELDTPEQDPEGLNDDAKTVV